ncbi:MAG: Sporulation and spore germination [Planctomycetes bacterium ADurb.Bin412]|nr:MAG: Sporulation and spore germination [Planctomycetes bacterium ADurb.Bin412]
MLNKVQKVLLALVLVAAITAGILALQNSQPAGENSSTGPGPGAGSDKQGETARDLVLYFSDDQAMYLLPERRKVAVGKGETTEQVIIKELIKGPSDPSLKRTIPPETAILSLSVENGVASVDFSKGIQDSRYGGSAGESMLIYSIVNSLAQLPEINQVQILVEGKKIESLYGHIGIIRPLSPNPGLIGESGRIQ